jgi:hypothetical protein
MSPADLSAASPRPPSSALAYAPVLGLPSATLALLLGGGRRSTSASTISRPKGQVCSNMQGRRS